MINTIHAEHLEGALRQAIRQAGYDPDTSPPLSEPGYVQVWRYALASLKYGCLNSISYQGYDILPLPK
jgi:hypothetical protein